MPRVDIDEDMEQMNITGSTNFQFSAVRPENLGATEYTLVVINVDVSGSVAPCADDLLAATKAVIEACGKSERSENLMIALNTFNHHREEIHGFKELHSINLADYKRFSCTGMTALYDAAYSSIGSILTYAEKLVDMDFDVNGISVTITDGYDNHSSMQVSDIAKQLVDSKKGEKIESLRTIVIGMKDPNDADSDWQRTSNMLKAFTDDSGQDQYVDMADATPDNLAKTAQFISQSISSQSQAIGSGGPSKKINW